MQLIPEWCEKFVKRVFVAFGLYVVGTVVVGVAKELMWTHGEREPERKEANL